MIKLSDNQMQTDCNYRLNKQRGITLIELMVAMAISSVIILGISNIYLATKKSYIVHDEFARLQENARYIINILSTNVRNAGFFGCASGQGLGTIRNGLNNHEQAAYNIQTGLMGYEADGTDIGDTKKLADPLIASGTRTDWDTAAGLTSQGTAISANPDQAVADLAIAGSDILIIRTTQGSGIRVLNNNGSGVIRVSNTGKVLGACANGTDKISGLCEDDILIASDCTKSVIFQATLLVEQTGASCNGTSPCLKINHAASGTPGNSPSSSANSGTTWNPPNDIFTEDAELLKTVTKTYFVGIANGATEPSLYVREGVATPLPLIEGIENIQILYGVDTSGDGTPNRYYSANDVPDVDGNSDTVFDGVVSIKMSLLLRTSNDLPGIKRSVANYASLVYDMVSPASPIKIDPINNDATSTDRKLRKVINLTIKIRNKSFNTAANI